MPVERQVAPPSRRPGDRRDRIIRAAGELFYERGYHSVTMSEIAKAVGITSSALYRHVPGKHQLLLEVITRAVDGYAAVVHTGAGKGLESLVAKLVRAALDWRVLGVLWQQEGRHLHADERTELRDKLWQVAVELAQTVRAERPSLDVEDSELLAACLLSVLASPSYHHVQLDRHNFEALLGSASLAVLDVDPVSRPGPRPAGNSQVSPLAYDRVLRRERLLTSAARRFARYGHPAVTLDDIAADAGVTGPNIYTYFATKDMLLVAAVTRGANWLHTQMSQILTVSASPEDALQELLASYAHFACHHRDIVQLLISELRHLPEQHRAELIQAQRDYVTEWGALLRSARPELAPDSAHCLVQAALTVANDVARTRRFRERTALEADIVAAGHAVLFHS